MSGGRCAPDRFVHDMPFGAVPVPGGVRFRLWAPGEREVAVALAEDDRVLPMQRGEDGFFELVTEAAKAGDRYRYRLADGTEVPDPAARFQPEDVHGASEVIDPRAYPWQQPAWTGRPWHEVVLYELHLGTFSAQGGYQGLLQRLDHLARLGITAIELMPVWDFSGGRNWGYDGVLPYAPDSAYGRPEELKRLIDACHGRSLMVFLDVVYNHFGPDGNFLSRYAPDAFDDAIHTPWGPAINYRLRPVRDFALHNVLYWLEEYRFDGLRFDAVDQIRDDSEPHLLVEIATAVRAKFGSERQVHLVLENDANLARLLPRDGDRATLYDAQWNDDFHHVAHHLLTGEQGGYYRDYAEQPLAGLGRALSSGFVYQGEASAHREGALRGEASAHLPPLAFVHFLQNHDQIGNRAFGERLTALSDPLALRAMLAVLLLAPQVPLLFMGEEWGTRRPFRFFTDFHDELADAVRDGRRREFAKFPAFSDPDARAGIPDPNALDTFAASCLDWDELALPEHGAWLALTIELLTIRRLEITPLLPAIGGHAGAFRPLGEHALEVTWQRADGGELVLLANLAADRLPLPEAAAGEVVYATQPDAKAGRQAVTALGPWSVLWLRRGPR